MIQRLILLSSLIFVSEGFSQVDKNGFVSRVDIVKKILSAEGFSDPLKDAVIENIKANPGKDRLVGKVGDKFFAVVFRKASSQNKAILIAAMSNAKVVSASDCLRYFVLDQVFFEKKMNRGVLAYEAIAKAYKETLVTGKMVPDFQLAVNVEGIVVGITIAKSSNMQGTISTSGDKAAFISCYRLLAHAEAEGFVINRNWKGAINALEHLVDVHVDDRTTWVSLGKCWAGLDNRNAASKAYSRALDLSENARSEWFANLGELALSLGVDGEEVALKAFSIACDRFEGENNTFDPKKVP